MLCLVLVFIGLVEEISCDSLKVIGDSKYYLSFPVEAESRFVSFQSGYEILFYMEHPAEGQNIKMFDINGKLLCETVLESRVKYSLQAIEPMEFLYGIEINSSESYLIRYKLESQATDPP